MLRARPCLRPVGLGKHIQVEIHGGGGDLSELPGQGRRG